jgi:hypothetical protein
MWLKIISIDHIDIPTLIAGGVKYHSSKKEDLTSQTESPVWERIPASTAVSLNS